MLVLVWGEVVWSGWVAWRVRRWLRGDDAAELRHALALGDHLHPLLQHLAHYHPLPEKVNQLMAEAEADLPRYLYVMASASCVLVALQLGAAALALCAAHTARRRRAHSRACSDVTITTPLRYVRKHVQIIRRLMHSKQKLKGKCNILQFAEGPQRQNSTQSRVQKRTSRDSVRLGDGDTGGSRGAEGHWILTISRRIATLPYGPIVDIFPSAPPARGGATAARSGIVLKLFGTRYLLTTATTWKWS
ncbi:unnamed protein product, partial [Brenthis ino]